MCEAMGCLAAEHGIQIRGHQHHLLVELRFADLLQSFLATPCRPFGLTDLSVADWGYPQIVDTSRLRGFVLG